MSETYNIYYIETNLICLVLLGIIYFRTRQNRSTFSASQRVLARLIAYLVVLCISDIVAGVFRGATFAFANVVLEASNLLYIVAMPLIATTWLFYVYARIGRPLTKKQMWCLRIPVILFLLVAVTNPFTHFIFSIDENNLYARGTGIYLHWIVSWFYLLFAGVVSVREYFTTQNWIYRQEVLPLIFFLVFPFIACVLQMVYYGVTVIQVGITLAIVLVSMKEQDNSISVDELTGINNRKALRGHIENVTARTSKEKLSIVMVDINHFKQINDTLGHAVGDIALKDTAQLLRTACGNAQERLFLCRYGGDEFVIVGHEMTGKALKALKTSIETTVLDFKEHAGKPYALEVSVGYASAEISSYEEFIVCLQQADEAMYEDKKQKKATR